MATIVQLQQKVKTLKKFSYLQSLLFEEVKRYSGLIIDIQQERLSKGQDTENNVLGTYKRSTELASLFGEVKPLQLKREGQPYNLEWSGGFFDGMTLTVFKTKAVFKSKGDSYKALILKYDNLMGLDEKGKESAISEFLLGAYQNRFRIHLELA